MDGADLMDGAGMAEAFEARMSVIGAHAAGTDAAKGQRLLPHMQERAVQRSSAGDRAGKHLLPYRSVVREQIERQRPVARRDEGDGFLQWYKSWLDGLERACKGAVDVFAGPRHNYATCVTQLEQAKKTPTDANALQTLYSQGMRNHLGATFHAALNTYKGGVARVTELLNEYEEALKKWHDSMQGAGPSTIAKSPAKRKEFVEDMEKALKMGKEILDLTK